MALLLLSILESRRHGPHRGQAAAARHLTELLDRSEIRESHRTNDPRIQDAYCLRCMPQVHGAVRDALDHVTSIVEIETGSATDNPLVFAASGDVLSGGNFHGAPLSYCLRLRGHRAHRSRRHMLNAASTA